MLLYSLCYYIHYVYYIRYVIQTLKIIQNVMEFSKDNGHSRNMENAAMFAVNGGMVV